MTAAIFAFAYPGEAARLMLAHPGIENWAPVAALATLAFLWLAVRLFSRSRLAAFSTAVIFAGMPAFRLGMFHPFGRNFRLAAVVAVIALVAVVWNLLRRRMSDAGGRYPLAAVCAACGASLFSTAALSSAAECNIYTAALTAVMAGSAMGYWWRHRSSILPKCSFWLLAAIFAFSAVFSLVTAGGDAPCIEMERAMVLMMKNDYRAARDRLVRAIAARPDVAAMHDLVLRLDILLNDPASAEGHAKDALRYDRRSPIANYVMGSLALAKDDLRSAERYLKRAADADKPVDLALNDLAETYRRLGRPGDGLEYARKAVEVNPRLYVAKATLASVLMDLDIEPRRALSLMNEAAEASGADGKTEDVRILVALARARLANADPEGAKTTLRKMKRNAADLAGFEKKEYEELLNRVK